MQNAVLCQAVDITKIWMHPLRICKVSKTNMLISLLKYMLHPTASMCCQNLDAPTRNFQNITDKYADQPTKNMLHPTAPTRCLCRTNVVGKNSFSKMYVRVSSVQCYRAHYVIKVLILEAYYKCSLILCIQYMCTQLQMPVSM